MHAGRTHGSPPAGGALCVSAAPTSFAHSGKCIENGASALIPWRCICNRLSARGVIRRSKLCREGFRLKAMEGFERGRGRPSGVCVTASNRRPKGAVCARGVKASGAAAPLRRAGGVAVYPPTSAALFRVSVSPGWNHETAPLFGAAPQAGGNLVTSCSRQAAGDTGLTALHPTPL